MSDSLIERFRAKGITRGGILMFAPIDAAELIEAADRDGRMVLGLDGFFVAAKTTQPSLDNSVDFSAEVSRGANPNKRALEFIREREGRGLNFEVVLRPG
jgi:hypothetical protein